VVNFDDSEFFRWSFSAVEVAKIDFEDGAGRLLQENER
jgi:hypothetical protein